MNHPYECALYLRFDVSVVDFQLFLEHLGQCFDRLALQGRIKLFPVKHFNVLRLNFEYARACDGLKFVIEQVHYFAFISKTLEVEARGDAELGSVLFIKLKCLGLNVVAQRDQLLLAEWSRSNVLFEELCTFGKWLHDWHFTLTL